MKVILATGGSAGHVFPALATAREFKNRGHEVALAGVFREWSEYARADAYPLTELSARGLNTHSFPSVLISSIYMLKSLRESVILLRQNSPDRVLGFGGYAAFPIVLAAVLTGIPAMIHEQNVRPGRANRLLAGLVSRIAVSFDRSKAYFPDRKTIVTGYPVYRSSGLTLSKAEAAAAFGFSADRFTILILGGSQGSQFVNQCFLKTIPCLKQHLSFQVIHISGHTDYPEVEKAHRNQDYPSFVRPFWDNMPMAYRAADLVICRSGAGTVTEIAACGSRAILIPYPHAQGHQKENAQVLVQAGRAQMFEQQDLTPEVLAQIIIDTYRKTREGGDMTRQPDPIYVPDAAVRLVEETVRLKR